MTFGEAADPSEFCRPAKPQPPVGAGEGHIEFGKSETDIFRVKKVQVPTELIHVAGTKIAFGDRNIPMDTDMGRAAKKQAPSYADASADHIIFGETAPVVAPVESDKCNVLTTFIEVCLYTYIYIYTYINLYTYIYTHAHTHTHTHTHTYKHTYTHT